LLLTVNSLKRDRARLVPTMLPDILALSLKNMSPAALGHAYVDPMRPEDLLCPSADGLHSKLGGFHIDPVRPVERALITHGHSDHARAGHGAVLATQETLDMMRLRYGENFAGATQAVRYGETLKLGKTEGSFHPAGHELGS